MKTTMVRYKIKPGEADRNEELVRAVYEELASGQPDGLRYATFRLDDGVTFVHLAESNGEGSPLLELDAFKRFQAELRDRCEELPVFSELSEVGNFRMLGA